MRSDAARPEAADKLGRGFMEKAGSRLHGESWVEAVGCTARDRHD